MLRVYNYTRILVINTLNRTAIRLRLDLFFIKLLTLNELINTF